MRVRQKLLIHASPSEAHSPRTHTCVVCITQRQRQMYCVLHKDKDLNHIHTYTTRTHTNTNTDKPNLKETTPFSEPNTTIGQTLAQYQPKEWLLSKSKLRITTPPLSLPCMTSLAQGRPPLPRFLCKLTSTLSSC